MEKIQIVTIGKLKDKYWQLAEADYLKKIKFFLDVETVILKESAEKKETNLIVEQESEKILQYLKKVPQYYSILLDRQGKMLDSIEFSQLLADNKDRLGGKLLFIIGGSWGVNEAVRKNVKKVISFSQLTFPHQLAKIILLEQIFRATAINNNRPYHK